MSNIKTDYRPYKLSEIVGHKVMKQTLRNQFQKGHISSGYILKGKTGGGKTTTARALAASINCENRLPNGDACGECESCRMVISGQHPDVREIPAADNNGKEMALALRDDVILSPLMKGNKIYILDECHMLSTACWNSLLKTIEEAPQACTFMFCTTEYEKIPDTIRNRCTVFDFGPLSEEDVAKYLETVAEKEGRAASDDACCAIAKYCDGSMRNALSILEKTLSYKANGEVNASDVLTAIGNNTEEYFHILENILKNSPEELITALSGYSERNSLEDLPNRLQEILTDALINKAGGRITGWSEYLEQVGNLCKNASMAALITVATAMLDLINIREKSRAVVLTGLVAILGKLPQKPICSAPVKTDTKPEAVVTSPAEPKIKPDKKEEPTVMPKRQDDDPQIPENLRVLHELSMQIPTIKWLLMPQNCKLGLLQDRVIIHTYDPAVGGILNQIFKTMSASGIEVDIKQ